MLIIKSRQKKRTLGLDEPLKHGSHKRPVTRRDFLAQGFITGSATVVAPSILGAMLNPRQARADLQPDMQFLADSTTICNIQQGAGKIPFICFDLAGGANIAGSNVLVGKEGGQLDFLSTQGYSKQGLPGDMLPNNATTDFINEEFGLMFHSDSAFLRGMLEKTSATTRAGVNGAVIAARSENDTGNNPHNPMYGIAQAARSRCARRAADADRLAELRLRRQLDGAGDADGSGESSDQDRSRLGCEPAWSIPARSARCSRCRTVSRTRPPRSRSWSRWRASANRSC